MSRDTNWFYWEAEGQQPGAPQPQQQPQPQQPQQQPQQPAPQPTPQPSAAKTEPTEKPDVTSDVQHPDLGGDEKDDKDFEEWKQDYLELAIKGDTQEMLRSLKNVQRHDLDATQHKFVYDNYNIQLIREDANIEKASREIRKSIKDSLDENYPATSVMQHVTESLGKLPVLNEIFFKLLGTGGGKSDYHRKFLGALTGAVQTGGGGSREDLLYSERDYSINLSTRITTEWGELPLGRWALKADDPQRYLSEPELDRMRDGSPEERIVLRHRVVISSIAEQFKERGFLIHVVSPSGTVHALGWDVGDSLKAGYVDGRLVVRTRTSDSAEAMINDDGSVTPIADLTVRFKKDTGKTDDSGNPVSREYPFLERIDGTLHLTAGVNTVRAMGDAMNGVFFKEVPFNGNPSDIKQLMKAVPSVADILLRKQ